MVRTPLRTETTELWAELVDDSSEDNKIGGQQGCRAQDRCRDSKIKASTQCSFQEEKQKCDVLHLEGTNERRVQTRPDPSAPADNLKQAG